MTPELKQRAEDLLHESRQIKHSESYTSPMGYTSVGGPLTNKWMNDVMIFASMLPDNYPLKKEIETTYSQRNKSTAFKNMVSYLESIIADDLTSALPGLTNTAKPSPEIKKYDLFISHANKDKSDYVDELWLALRKLGIHIFYDTDVISWGDNWKQTILDGTAKSEFAIIVISENFFGREWTERELDEFLKRQNTDGQKIVLPLLHNISQDMLNKQYPFLKEIQAIDTAQFSKEQITILFAKELIKRLR